MRKKGRPLKYSESLVRKILDYLEEDKYSYSQICRKVGITYPTFARWRSEKEEFREAIELAEETCRQNYAIEAKKSLKKKIKGYHETETRTVKRPDGEGELKVVEVTETRKHIPPDTTAIIFALTNTDPQNWKNRHSAEVTGKDGKDLISNMTDEELDAEIKELERKLRK